MKLVRKKIFNTFKEGKDEVLDILPFVNISYIELANCNTYEETFTKLQTYDEGLSVKVNKITEMSYEFILTFCNNNYITTTNPRLNVRQWSLDRDETFGYGPEQLYEIETM